MVGIVKMVVLVQLDLIFLVLVLFKVIVIINFFEGCIFKEWVQLFVVEDLCCIENSIWVGMVQVESSFEIAWCVVGMVCFKGVDGVIEIIWCVLAVS